jgi:hypothetical protein
MRLIPRWLWLTVAFCALAFAAAEALAFFGIVDYRHVIDANPIRVNYIDDPELGYIHRPYSHLAGSSLGGYASEVYDLPPSEKSTYRWDAKYDRNGFRNATDLKSASVIVLGDSFVEGTEGATLTEAQIIPSLLAVKRGEVVANLSHNTYGPQQELAVLRRYGLPLHPATVIWVFSESSDLGDAWRYSAIRQRASSVWLSFVDRSLTQNTLNWLRDLRRRRYPKDAVATGQGGLQNANGAVNVYFTPSDGFSTEPIGPNPRGLNELKQTLKAGADMCAAQGCRLILVYAPDKFRVLRDFCTFPAESKWKGRRFNDFPDRMAAITRSLSPSVGFLDLTPALMDDVKSGRLPYATDDYHWNAEGHKVAAMAIANYLASN